jgi:hypothetical protein
MTMTFKRLAAGALTVAALGIHVQIAGRSLPGYPLVPPGAIVLLG